MNKTYLRFSGGKTFRVLDSPPDHHKNFYFLFFDRDQLLSYFNIDARADLMHCHCFYAHPSKLGLKKLQVSDCYYYVILCDGKSGWECEKDCAQYKKIFASQSMVVLLEERATDGEIHDVSLEMSRTFKSFALDRMIPISYTPFSFHNIPFKTKRKTVKKLSFGPENQFTIAFLEGEAIKVTPNLGDVRDVMKMEEMDRMVKAVMGHLKVEDNLLLRGYNNYSLVANYLRGHRYVKKVSNIFAHLAATMYDNDMTSDKGIGVVYDTKAFGPQGEMLGGEIVYGGMADFEIVGRWKPIPLPGGDIANVEPWRITLAVIKEMFHSDFENIKLPMIQKLKENERQRYMFDAINRGLISYGLSSSLHHILSAIGELIWYEETTIDQHFFESYFNEMLEESMEEEETEVKIEEKDGVFELNTYDIFQSVISGLFSGEDKRTLLNRALGTLAAGTAELVSRLAKLKNEKKVFLSGDLFTNTAFLELLYRSLEKRGLIVMTNRHIPLDDSCLAVGQLILEVFSK